MSTPKLTDFNPNEIPWQIECVSYIRNYDYSQGILECLMSGSIGSAKSILAAHIIVTHAIGNPGSRTLVLRRALKDLKRTLWDLIITHLSDSPHLIQSYNKSEMKIVIHGGSTIIGDSYDKGDLEKFRSLELSMVAFEEASESDKNVYDAVKMRVGRCLGVRENLILCLTNPDEPDHYLYKHFIQQDAPSRKVFYSLTEKNKFLPKWYIENLKNDLDPMMAKRMLQGQWVSIRGESIYYAYNTTKQFLKDKSYVFNPRYPIDIMHDFNIGKNKPMSCAVGQIINGVVHIAKDFVIDGFRTEQIMEEMADYGIFELSNRYRIFGDAAGRHNDTRNNRNDYDIIEQYLARYRNKRGEYLIYENEVPLANPPIRARQNLANARCLNDNGKVRLYVYKDALTVDEGFRLTKLKKRSTYQEDDNDRFQHVITAVGYYIHRITTYLEHKQEANITFL